MQLFAGSSASRRRRRPSRRAPASQRFEADLPALEAGRPADAARCHVRGTRSIQTVCQIPVVRGYQIECGSSCQSCLPRGLARSCGSSSARTTTGNGTAGPSGDVEAEWRVTAFVIADALPVDPDRGVVIDGPEMQNHALSIVGLRERHGPTVPARAEKRRMTNSARWCFRCEWHLDRGIPPNVGRRLPHGVAIDGEIPPAVQ